MRGSQLLAGIVVVLAAVWLIGALVTLVLNALGPATVVALIVVILAVGGASAVGMRSRRWRTNPYW